MHDQRGIHKQRNYFERFEQDPAGVFNLTDYQGNYLGTATEAGNINIYRCQVPDASPPPGEAFPSSD
jgi:hypothetical protein